jgi:hypothetical protein
LKDLLAVAALDRLARQIVPDLKLLAAGRVRALHDDRHAQRPSNK